MSLPRILLIEPYYGGSHKILIDLIKEELEKKYPEQLILFLSMSAKKWHWRARTSSLYLSEIIPTEHEFRVIFTSSVMNLAELLALRQDLAGCRKVVYFHENQLVYPVRQKKERDFQYGYNEILTCLVADLVIFNSQYNYRSFMDNLKSHFRMQPDYRPKCVYEKISAKSQVLYFPIRMGSVLLSSKKNYNKPLHIVWPHRWEHDKGLDEFITVLLRLSQQNNLHFEISMLGEQTTDIDDKYMNARQSLGDRVKHWGYLQDKGEYYNVLSQAHLAVSTALHEFFGVSMMECTMAGCFPLCPNRLVYPELYPEQCLYNSQEELLKTIVNFANNMQLLEQQTATVININWSHYSVENLLPKYLECLL